MLADLLANATGLIWALPNVDPQQPPGMENLTTVLGWIAWGVSVLCLAAFLVCAGWLAIATLTGQSRVVQVATAGSPMIGVSLRGAMVSSVM